MPAWSSDLIQVGNDHRAWRCAAADLLIMKRPQGAENPQQQHSPAPNTGKDGGEPDR
jgi:hypothetical protein